MSWDEKAEDYAVAHHTYDRLEPSVNAWGYKMIGVGAEWQRDQLRTDEAVERVARGICRRNWPKNEDFVHYWHWYCDDFRADASAAIDALLGEDA